MWRPLFKQLGDKAIVGIMEKDIDRIVGAEIEVGIANLVKAYKKREENMNSFRDKVTSRLNHKAHA